MRGRCDALFFRLHTSHARCTLLFFAFCDALSFGSSSWEDMPLSVCHRCYEASVSRCSRSRLRVRMRSGSVDETGRDKVERGAWQTSGDS